MSSRSTQSRRGGRGASPGSLARARRGLAGIAALLGGALATAGSGLHASGDGGSPKLGSSLASLAAALPPAPELGEPEADPLSAAEIRREPKTGHVRRLQGRIEVPAARSPRDAAARFLRGRAAAFGLSNSLAELQEAGAIESLTGTHLHYRQRYAGLPVFDGRLAVHTDAGTAVTGVEQDLVPIDRPAPLAAPGTPARAIAAGLRLLPAGTPLRFAPAAEPGVWVDRGVPRTGWRVQLATRSPAADWELLVDAATGQVVSARNRACYATGSGRIFAPNPVATSGNGRLTDGDDRDSPELQAETVVRPLLGLDGTGFLQGEWASTASTWAFSRAKRPDLQFNFPRSDPRFGEVMAYYWVDANRRYLMSLGFDSVLARPVRIDVNGTEDDNSFFSPFAGELTFGTGGVDDAEDADIILHETGHAIQHSLVPGYGLSDEAGAIGEGFGDYWAASFSAGVGPRAPEWDVFIAEWDAVSYRFSSPPFLRRVDSPKRYPGSIIGEVHADGELWSAALWQIRTLLGRQRADTIIVESNFSLPANAGFVDGCQALLRANRSLYGGADEEGIVEILTDRGFLTPGRLKLSTNNLVFGAGKRGGTVRRTVSIKNRGTGVLTGFVGSLAAPYRVAAGGGSFSLEARQQRTVYVDWTPGTGAARPAELRITSSDPSTPVAVVTLTARAK
jgi:Zn-dependent metalloprotease